MAHTRLKHHLLLLVCLVLPYLASAQNRDTVKIHSDLPVLSAEDKVTADIYYQSASTQTAILNYACYKYDAKGDSVLIASRKGYEFEMKSGVHSQTVSFISQDNSAGFHATYHAVLKKTGAIPPGTYRIYLTLSTDSNSASKVLIHQVDSNLSPTSSLRKELNSTLIPDKKSKVLGIDLSRQAGTVNKLAKNTTKTLDRASGKMDRLFKSKGLTSVTEKRDGKEVISLYYENWFVGRYEVKLDQSLDGQISKQKDQLTAPIASLANNELEGYRSLLSQVKELTKQKKEERQITGEIGLTGNWANAQPEYSQEDNNYYEVRGRVETKIKDIPVSIEGYYTTQDKYRQIKSSYIRIHYDAEKSKEELMELVGGFKNQFSQTLSKGKGLEQIYGSYLNNIAGEKNVLLSELKKETGVSDINTSTLDTAGLQAQIATSLKAKMTDTVAIDSNNVDSVSKLKIAQTKALRTADSANKIYQKALKKYQRLVALEQTARKYYALVAQYKETNFFDSSLGYAKLQDIDKADMNSPQTYKQLAKSASELLPDGKVKKFVTGLTNLDLGIFPKDLSKYTMAGQQMKGIDAGYDLGFCEVGATYGSTEFAGRDGTLDKYTAYSGRALFKPLKDQKLTLVYYGYTPSKRAMSKDTFFKDIDIALPSFREPVHIISAAYEGTIAKNIRVDGEIATSMQNGNKKQLKDQLSSDNIAWQINVEGMIPKTTINLAASYQHGGDKFQNNTLPVNPGGTNILRIGAKGDLFKSFLTLGAEYNNIQQQNYYSTGNNSRWGFEVATHSKRYPSVSLSYKPYTTFRSYTDTLAIPQRPLIGAVLTGRATYQFKKTGGRSWRFSAVYNKSTSEIDTTAFGSNLIQAIATYTTKTWMLTGSIGNMDQTTNGRPVMDAPAHTRTTFGMVMGSYTLTKQTTVSGGLDIGVAKFGLSKWGLNGGCSYWMIKIPITLRVMGRFSKYRLQETEGWKPVYGGSLDVLWQFKMKLTK